MGKTITQTKWKKNTDYITYISKIIKNKAIVVSVLFSRSYYRSIQLDLMLEGAE
jgi:hypothetical protein